MATGDTPGSATIAVTGITEKLSARVFVTKAEIREAMFVESAEQDRTDEELNALYRLANMVCSGIENHIRKPIIIQQFVQYDGDGDEEIFLKRRPVVAVSEVLDVVENTVWPSTDYAVDLDTGIVTSLIGSFPSGTHAVKVTYTAGYGTQTRDVDDELTLVTDVPDDLKLAAFTWLLQSWRQGPENYSPQQSETVGRWGTGIPKEVVEILCPYHVGPALG